MALVHSGLFAGLQGGLVRQERPNSIAQGLAGAANVLQQQQQLAEAREARVQQQAQAEGIRQLRAKAAQGDQQALAQLDLMEKGGAARQQQAIQSQELRQLANRALGGDQEAAQALFAANPVLAKEVDSRIALKGLSPEQQQAVRVFGDQGIDFIKEANNQAQIEQETGLKLDATGRKIFGQVMQMAAHGASPSQIEATYGDTIELLGLTDQFNQFAAQPESQEIAKQYTEAARARGELADPFEQQLEERRVAAREQVNQLNQEAADLKKLDKEDRKQVLSDTYDLAIDNVNDTLQRYGVAAAEGGLVANVSDVLKNISPTAVSDFNAELDSALTAMALSDLKETRGPQISNEDVQQALKEWGVGDLGISADTKLRIINRKLEEQAAKLGRDARTVGGSAARSSMFRGNAEAGLKAAQELGIQL